MTCCLDKDGDLFRDDLPVLRMTYHKVHRLKCEDVWYSEMRNLRNEGCVAICSRIAPNSGTFTRAADPSLCKCADRWNVTAVLRAARRQKGCLTRIASTHPVFNPLNAELNPICHLLALLGPHHIFHVSGLRVNEQRNVIHEQTMKAQGQVEVYLHSYLTLVLDGGEWSMSHLGGLTLCKERQYLMNWRLGGRQRRSGCSGGEQISYPFHISELGSSNPKTNRCTKYLMWRISNCGLG